MTRVLVLETDRQLARNVSDFLSSAGYAVEVFSDPQNAISAADAHCPNVVVLDLVLAGRSGVEFLYELRSYPEWQKIPVIITSKLSAEELDDYRPVLSQLNVSNYLHKPTAPLQELATMIQKLAPLAA